jgi:PAS domain S-box-containing protein
LASIWAIPCIALALAAAVLVWISYEEYQETVEQEYRFLDAHARIAQNQIAELVHDVKRVLGRISAAATAAGANHGAMLADYGREIPEVRTLAILDSTGRVAAAANPSLVGFDGSRREYFTAHLGGPRQRDLHISRPYKSVYGDYSISFSLPVIDAQRSLAGVVVAGVHYKYFDSVVNGIRPTQPHSTVVIANNDGDFLYRQPDPETSVGRNGARNESFRAFLAAERKTTFARSISTTDGVDRLYVHRAIPDTPLNISISRPVDDVLATWRRNLEWRLVLFALGAALMLRLTWVAERRQREALSSKELAERLIDTANAMMVGVDSDGRIISVNEATERVSGYRRDELLGRSFFETIMPRDRFPQAWEAFQRYRSGGKMPRAFEAPILTRNGDTRIVAWQNSRAFEHTDPLAILAFGIDVTERAQLAHARRREETSRRLIDIHEEERRRLATELHDRTSPNLSVLDINLKLLAASLPPEASADVTRILEDSSATLQDTIASIRSVSFDFRPPLLDYAGLWPALNAYARQFSRSTGIVVHVTGEEGLRLPPETETNLFRIAQEALTNCARHSSAERISVCQTTEHDEIVLSISDDGVGFEAAGTDGKGLAMMRQRAKYIGGYLELQTRPGEGTRVAVRFSAARLSSSCDVPRVIHFPPSHSSAPSAAVLPLAKQAVNR